MEISRQYLLKAAISVDYAPLKLEEIGSCMERSRQDLPRAAIFVDCVPNKLEYIGSENRPINKGCAIPGTYIFVCFYTVRLVGCVATRKAHTSAADWHPYERVLKAMHRTNRASRGAS